MEQGTPTPAQVHCDQCRQPFAPKKPWQRFCSKVCRRDFHKAGGDPDAKRMAELEARVRDLEAAVWPLGK